MPQGAPWPLRFWCGLPGPESAGFCCGYGSSGLWAGGGIHFSCPDDGYFLHQSDPEGAVAGMVVGLGVTLFYVFQHKGVIVSDWRFLPGLGSNWFYCRFWLCRCGD